MIEIRIEGLPADVSAAHERLASTFEILSVSRDYPNRGSKLVRRFVKVEVKVAPELGPAGLTELIQALLAGSHSGIQEAINPTKELSAYHAGYQAALMELARSAGIVPDAQSSETLPAPDPKHGEKRLCANCGNGIQYSQFSGWQHMDLEPMIIDPETRKILGICGKPEPAPKTKRKPDRKKQQGFWLETESGPIHCLADPAMADDPEFRANVEAMAKAAQREAKRFNEGES